MKIEVDVTEAAAAEISKRDRQIARLAKQLEEALRERDRLLQTMKSIAAVKQAMIGAAEHIDPYVFSDD